MNEHMPSVGDLSTLLQKYFVGATDAAAWRLHGELHDVVADPARRAGEASAFDVRNGGRRTYGQAWREELAFDDGSPTLLQLAAWLAATGDNYPEPRPYCPDVFIGSWQQRAPVSGPRWQFAADGSFICDEPLLQIRVSWRLHRQSSKGPVGDVIWLDDELRIAHTSLLILAVSTGNLKMELPGPDAEYVLMRI